MKNVSNSSKVFIIASITLFLGSGFAAAENAPDAAARQVVVQAIQGNAYYQSKGENLWQALQLGQVLKQEDRIKTDDQGSVEMLVQGEAPATAKLGSASAVEFASLKSVETGDDTELYLTDGTVKIQSDKLKRRSRFEVRTPNSIVGIRGTTFEVSVE